VLAGEAFLSTPGRSLSYHRSRVCLTASVHGGSTNFAGSLRPTGWVGPKGGVQPIGALRGDQVRLAACPPYRFRR
jgi:hypothetical protein